MCSLQERYKESPVGPLTEATSGRESAMISQFLNILQNVHDEAASDGKIADDAKELREEIGEALFIWSRSASEETQIDMLNLLSMLGPSLYNCAWSDDFFEPLNWFFDSKNESVCREIARLFGTRISWLDPLEDESNKYYAKHGKYSFMEQWADWKCALFEQQLDQTVYANGKVVAALVDKKTLKRYESHCLFADDPAAYKFPIPSNYVANQSGIIDELVARLQKRLKNGLAQDEKQMAFQSSIHGKFEHVDICTVGSRQQLCRFATYRKQVRRAYLLGQRSGIKGESEQLKL